MSNTDKRPRPQVLPIANKLLDLFAPFCEHIELAGSLRREASMIGDIEICCIPKVITTPDMFGGSAIACSLLKNELDRLLSEGKIDHIEPRHWGEINRRFTFITGQLETVYSIDLYMWDAENWLFNFLIKTGPKSFSKAMITEQRKGGYLPNGWCIKNGFKIYDATDTHQPVESERDIFEVSEGEQENMRHIIPISGKDSACTAVVQIEKNPDLEYEFMFNPTGAELPPVYDWLDKVSDYLGKPIVYVGADLESATKDAGILPSVKVRFCTRLCKIVPMEEWIYENQESATVYYGLRSDEMDRVGYESKTANATITAEYPLREMGINLPLVWKILKDRDLLPPFFEWKSVTDLVKKQMGNDFKIVEQLDEWEYQTLFSWRTRQFNCFWCFFMRQYEYIGLLENYPDHFWKAVEIERTTGAENFTIRQGYCLSDLVSRADKIKKRRVNEIVKILYSRIQGKLIASVTDAAAS